MRNWRLNLVWMFAAVLGAAGAAEPELLRDMVRFDQAYIPVLALTSAEQQAPSRRSYSVLWREWQRFRGRQNEAFPEDAGWSRDLAVVEAHLKEAGLIIERGEHLKKAHEALEDVRQIMMGARERHHIDYFIDHLTRYHDPMEAIVLKAKNTPELSSADVEELEQRTHLADQLWKKVKNAQFDADLFEFDESRLTTLRQSMLREEEAISRLTKALASADRAAVTKAGLGLKPPFAECFKLFGRFPGEGKH